MALVLVGTVALTATLFLQERSRVDALKLYGDSLNDEKTQAFLQFIAKYGKTYATKSDMHSRFTTFSETFDKVQAHNSAAG